MSEGNHELEALERELADLGPLMLRQERVETQGPDPAFAAQLRARLVSQAEERFPAPAPPAPARPVAPREPRQRRWFQWGSLGGVALVAAAVVLFFLLRAPQKTQSPGGNSVALAPTPTKGVLSKSYPLLGGIGGGGGPVAPTQSRIEYIVGQPYPGHLKLSAGSLPGTPSTVTAYRLRGPSFDAPRIRQLARTLGITDPIMHMKALEIYGPVTYQTTWTTVAQGGGPTVPIHSLAISLRTGQVIYHNRALDPKTPGSASGPSHAAAVAAARGWLIRLGWPGAAMPETTVAGLSGFPGTTEVNLGWPGVGAVDRPAATLWVAPRGGIDEALLQPPVAASLSARPLPLSRVWKQVQAGKVPIGVENMIVAAFPKGTGTLQSVTNAHVFNPTPGGTLYLVPVYHFAGTVHFPGIAGPRKWFALAPAE